MNQCETVVCRISMLATGLFWGACSDGGGEPGGREWVNAGHSLEVKLVPDGKLSIDKRFHPVVQNRYSGFIQVVADVFKKRQLYNRTPTPFRIYLMFDAASYQKFGGLDLDGLGEFVPAQSAIYLHADGKPLTDRGQIRRLVREIALAVIHDMYEAAYPKWFAVGLSRFLADGAFEADKWLRGVPDHEAWRELLGRRGESIDLLLKASDAEFVGLGEFGAALAHAVVYLLRELDESKFSAVVYQAQIRNVSDNAGLVKLLDEFVPNYQKRLASPVETLFTLRPDLLSYLECGLAPASSDILAKSRTNVEIFATNGSYWYQHACLELKVGGDKAKAIAAFEKSRTCETHRFLPACLDALADLYSEADDLKALGVVVLQRMQVSVMLTPRMHRHMAEVYAKSDKVQAVHHVDAGLDLPPEGFEADVAKLRKLKELLK